jgi:hypothetical protein
MMLFPEQQDHHHPHGGSSSRGKQIREHTQHGVKKKPQLQRLHKKKKSSPRPMIKSSSATA